MFVTFPSGAVELEGALVLPSGSTQGAVVCHPHPQYGGEMDNPIVRAVAGAFERRGYATLRFNFRGVGRSGGSYDSGRGEVEDVRAAIQCVLERAHVWSVTLAGYSFGAVMALQAGAERPEVTGLVAVAPPAAAFDSVTALLSCDKPKLFIVGDCDQFCDQATLRRQLSRLPGPTTLEIIAGADHFFSRHAAAVAQAVTRFLNSEKAPH